MKRCSPLLRGLAALILVSPGFALAGGGSGAIESIWALPNTQFIMFSLSGKSADYHRCNDSRRYSIDLTRPGGRESYQLLLLAKEIKLSIKVESLNTCNPFHAENVLSIQAQ